MKNGTFKIIGPNQRIQLTEDKKAEKKRRKRGRESFSDMPTPKRLPTRFTRFVSTWSRGSLFVLGQIRLHGRFQLHIDVAGRLMLSRHVIGRQQNDPVLADELRGPRGRLG